MSDVNVEALSVGFVAQVESVADIVIPENKHLAWLCMLSDPESNELRFAALE